MPAPQNSPASVSARPLRLRLLLLAASGLVPLLLVLAWGITYLVTERREEAQRTALEMSRALATAISAELRAAEAVLQQMGTADALERGDLREFYWLAERAADQLGWHEVVLSDPNGVPLLRTGEPFGAPTQASREPRSIAQAVASQRPVVSPVFTILEARSDYFAVRVPIVRSGQVVYVLSAVLPVDTILVVLQTQDIPAGSVVSIYDQAQRRVARSREMPTPAPSPSLKAILDRGEPYGHGRAYPPNGLESYLGYTRLAHSGWVVVVGNAVAQADKGLHALLASLALGVAASLAASALLAWMLARQVAAPVDALKQAAADLGQGRPVDLPTLDVEELEGVARALRGAAVDRDRAAAQVTGALRMAEEASRSKDQFMAMLGHELRNPLAPIATAVQLMALKGDAATARERAIIERQLGHVIRLVDDLLDISRITSGRLALQRAPLRMAELLRHVVDGVRPSLRDQTLTLELAPGAEQAWIEGDEVRVAQVFNNLLVNAIKFTPAGGSIRVRAAPEGGELRVDIADSGVGLSSEELDRIFDLFYQAPQNVDRARGGLGLGLPIVSKLVAMHGGRVTASSPGVGQGTCLTVSLPLREPPAATEPPTAARAASGDARILVVDDNEDAAVTCATLLEASGYTVRVAHTPADALALLAPFSPQLAVLDIGLPGMSGYELAAHMKAAPHHYTGQLVALTGYGQATDRASSQTAGFAAHLTKPVPPAELLALIGRLLQPALGETASAPG